MTLDLARAAALLGRLPAEARPAGGLQLVDAAAPFEPNPTVPTLLLGLEGVGPRGAALGTLRQALAAEQPVWLIPSDGAPRRVTAGALDAALDGSAAPGATMDGAVALYVPPVAPDAAERSLAGLRHVVHRLRAPGGCPWDRKQTHESLARYVVEEAYEVVDAIQHHGPEELAEELGDLLLQVFLQSELAEEAGRFTLNDVVERITTKLIRRHPHVFADVVVSGAADVERNWEALKQAEKSDRLSVLDGIPKSLPSLARAAEIQKRMRKAGFEWPTRAEAEAKLAEELAELQDAATPEEAAAELGDVLFVLTGLGAWSGVDAEEGLRATNAKVEARFRYLEARVRERGLAIADLPLAELVALWNEAKSLDTLPR